MDYLSTSDIVPLPSPRLLRHQIPLSVQQKLFIKGSRQIIRNILLGSDRRWLVVVGPCSVHDPGALCEYAARLASLQRELPKLYLVLRFYLEKSRTSVGWKGFLCDPELDGSHNIDEGLRISRKMLGHCATLQLPVGTEFLDPHFSFYLEDGVSWGCIGARTVTSPVHRQMASLLPMPIGFKNSIDGSVEAALQAMLTAQLPQTFPFTNLEGSLCRIKSLGQREGHLVLRGGPCKVNYQASNIVEACQRLHELGLPKRLLVDCSHGNAVPKPEGQVPAFYNVLEQRLQGADAIRGVMLESHLFEGRQTLSGVPGQMEYGVSITDPCLEWEATASLLREAHSLLSAEPTRHAGMVGKLIS